MVYQLTDSFIVRTDLAATWDFFCRAENLSRITPPWMNFTVDTPSPIEMKTGSLIDYTIRWMKIPMHWRTRITDWQPPHRFVDTQLKGPYSQWIHTHTFEPVEGGTKCTDQVEYRLPLPIIGPITHGLIVKRQLLEIFRYRRKAIDQILGIESLLQPDVQITAKQ